MIQCISTIVESVFGARLDSSEIHFIYPRGLGCHMLDMARTTLLLIPEMRPPGTSVLLIYVCDCLVSLEFGLA